MRKTKKTNGIEKSVFLDHKGNIISIGEGIKGKVGFTNTADETKQLNRAKALSVTMYHNHYKNTTFSANDIDMLLKQSCLGTIYAVCNNGTYFKLQKTHNFGIEILKNDIISEYNEIACSAESKDDIIKEFCKRYDMKYTQGVF